MYKIRERQDPDECQDDDRSSPRDGRLRSGRSAASSVAGALVSSWGAVARVLVLVTALAGLMLLFTALVPASTTMEIGPVRIARTHLA